MPRWSKLTRIVRDKTDDVTLRTRDDAQNYMLALSRYRERSSQWQAAARAILEGGDAERVTRAIEGALFFEARLDVRLTDEQRR
jgi:hypothetical protein